MTLPKIGGFSAPGTADYAEMGYDGSNRLITVSYKQGGETGLAIGTLNIAYVGATTDILKVYWS